ncbi:MAG: RNA polymerase sigma factor RpoH [Magnetovibrio sp.]|nr:RNA polymerase sigma factor RpoH [Magnetovibrio sp.]|tara:strand:+ start:2242 stop:3144 length:903 start_codon:yes stop_codon:yes gene_type:complete
MSNIALPTLPAEGSLSQYFREVWAFPMLDADTEQTLALQFRDHGDVDAAHKLVTSYLRLVCKIAMGYRGYGLPVADLISEGNIGLMKAVKKFDPDRGFRLSTYAMWWIKAAITEYVLKSWSLVKLGTVASQKKLFFRLRNLKARLGITDNGDLSPSEVALLSDATDARPEDVIQINRRINGRDLSLNAPVSDTEDSLDYQDTLVDEGPSPETALANIENRQLQRELFQNAMKGLNERERHIFSERKLSAEPATLEELGQSYGLSRERIRQIEAKAMDHVEAFVRKAALEDDAVRAAAFVS